MLCASMLHAVILAGGSGTRFWPLSRRDRPKQLLALAGPRTLLQGTWDRVRRLVPADAVHVVTAGPALAQATREQLPDLAPERLVVEPEPRDTAVAIGLAARLIARHDPEAVLVITPADHVVRPDEAFAAAVQEAAALAATRGVATLGVRPRLPHTGYGYIRRGEPLAGWSGRTPAYAARAFEEKPDRETAARFVAGGEHLWNSGVFVWRAATVLELLGAHLPATRAAIERIVAAWDGPAREATLQAEYAAVQRISIDYAVLEKARDIAVLEVDYEWSDVGSWSAVAELHTGEADAAANVAQGAPFLGVDARGCFVQGDGRLIAVVGLENVAIVQTADATLVCPLDRAEAVKELVKSLDASGLRSFT